MNQNNGIAGYKSKNQRYEIHDKLIKLSIDMDELSIDIAELEKLSQFEITEMSKSQAMSIFSGFIKRWANDIVDCYKFTVDKSEQNNQSDANSDQLSLDLPVSDDGVVSVNK